MLRSARARLHRPSTGTALGLVAVTLAVGGVAYAAIPSADGTISACYNAGSNPSGQLRIIDAESGTKCTKNERLLTFNQRGPIGPTGLQGPQGVPGTPGTNGTDGINGTNGTNGKDGAAGTSDLYISDQGDASALGANANSHTTITVGAGSYLISGKAQIENLDNDTQPADCHLNTGDRTELVVPSNSLYNNISQFPKLSLTVMDSGTFQGNTTIAMDCHIYSGSITHIVLSAVKVTTIH